MDEGGGHMIFGYDLAAAPTFTLYGDGTYILRQLEDPERADPALGFTRFLHGQMNDEYVQALLRFALGQGRLLDAKEDYPNNSCADCTTTTFTLNAAGLEKAVSIYALGQDEGPDAADRRGFGELRETITGLEHRAKSGELGEVVLYDPEFYRVVLLEGFGDAPADWPWDHISVDDFELVAESGHRQLIMGRDDVEMLIEVPSGGHPGIVVEDEDGALWQIGVRPLLPEELPADLPADG